MTLEERIKEFEELANLEGKYKSNFKEFHEIVLYFGQDIAIKVLPIIQELQQERDNYKHLWETNAQESNEIIAELKAENEKLKEVIKKSYLEKLNKVT